MNTDTYRFEFGIYDGMLYREVKKMDPHYILWCSENVPEFKLSEDEIDDIKARVKAKEYP